jgi:D-beta-D-heptose 7-phosphate kinase/D-beta-D-heptose 1-phosphate adenosyltransferase
VTGPDLTALVEGLAGARVLCVGDVMLDRFVYGEVAQDVSRTPENLSRVARPQHGNQTVGHLVAAAEADRGGLLVLPGRATTVKTRFVAGGQQMLRVDDETTVQPHEADARRISGLVAERLAACDAVILSDYGKGVLGDAVLRSVLDAAAREGRPVFVDPKGVDYARYRGARVLTPNLRELAQASGAAVGGDEAVVAAARRLIEHSGIGAILATRSEEGMTLVDGAEAPLHLPAVAREVYDVSGAGDTVVAVLAAGSAAGADLGAAAALANVAAGLVVGKLGTAVVEPSELIDAILIGALGTAESKVLGLQSAAERVTEWRRAGLRIGFTNGCFDLLHPGHVSLLEQATRACDRLVVGLNSDASVRRLKGEHRPVQGEAARSAVLASLQSVDAVVIFAEDTPMTLIRRLRPDVLVKGGDYTVDTVVGADLVRGYGGRILLADLLAGHSTTGTIRRLGTDGQG